ncbi:Tim44/TimA family putative adaptor protein [Hellea balneolensis]|uniref:Tim44/TimA family putative adaptor protein n=1 Tax=Hellea balneolensis TaxID=287478 RepID=UPI00041758E4|nr:Tim44/TimA family putative adaptor protein [Hellea balneolensis]
MYEVILYAAIATIVCVMLYSVLGKSVGQGPESGFDAEKAIKDSESANNKVVQLNSSNTPPTGLEAIAAADSNFSPAYFMDGAKAAYSMILEAFAAGDREQLESLLTSDVYKVYAEAIDAREADNLTQVTDLGRLRKAMIKEAELDGKMARIEVLYESELTSALMDKDGNVVQGDPDILSSISEVWTFERNVKSSDINWRLSDVSPSEGDALEADPTPDTKK